ncbi:MAG: VanZ family protein [Janthinobacterium lividum]
MISDPSLQRSQLLAVWGGVLLAVLAIAGESTAGMSHAHTGVWLHKLLGSHLDSGALNRVNTALRKSGHLIGYGMVGLMTFHAVQITATLRKAAQPLCNMKQVAAVAGVLFTFFLAVCDEVHQRYLPGRTASIRDVVLDTCGAILFLAAAEFIPWRQYITTVQSRSCSVPAPISA